MNKIERIVLLQQLQKELAYVGYDRLSLHFLIDLRNEVSKSLVKECEASGLPEAARTKLFVEVSGTEPRIQNLESQDRSPAVATPQRREKPRGEEE
jgi:hypothetical protein